MKLAIIINSMDAKLIASRYKYTKLFQSIWGNNDVKIFDERFFNNIKSFGPDYCIVFGSFRKTYKIPMRLRIPYILCEHDVISMYRTDEQFDEPRKIRHAAKIIFTSPDHQEHIIKKYSYPEIKTRVLYLRPSIQDLDFKPLPKLPGKNLVYIGGLLDNTMHNNMVGRFGYRCYSDMFEYLIELGWDVHLYPIRKRPDIYHKIGCIYHPRFNEGKDLFQQLSQYTAGIQGFHLVGSSFDYAKTCRPNKIWNYLASGIPTIGINPGNGIELYQDKWGYELKNLDDIETLDFSKLDIAKYRAEEVIESQADEIRKFIEG